MRAVQDDNVTWLETAQKAIIFWRGDQRDGGDTVISASGAVDIGGVSVTPFGSVAAAASRIVPALGQVEPGFWIAINAEKVMRARASPEVAALLRSGTVCYPDGISVVWTMKQKGAHTVRVPGVELWEAVMHRAGDLEVPVFLIGAREGVLARVTERLAEETSVRIVGAVHGYADLGPSLVHEIRSSGARIVSVALGSPTQEAFIERCRVALPEAFYMGVGGTFDVYAGEIRRAPVWMRRAGLEWFFRLLRQPNRLWRQRILLQYLLAHTLRRL